MWVTFLDNFNGRAYFLSDRWETSSTLELYTDAAASKGHGAVFWTALVWRRFSKGIAQFQHYFPELFLPGGYLTKFCTGRLRP